MVEIQAKNAALGDEPISVRGYIDRDDELMVKSKVLFTTLKNNSGFLRSPH